MTDYSFAFCAASAASSATVRSGPNSTQHQTVRPSDQYQYCGVGSEQDKRPWQQIDQGTAVPQVGIYTMENELFEWHETNTRYLLTHRRARLRNLGKCEGNNMAGINLFTQYMLCTAVRTAVQEECRDLLTSPGTAAGRATVINGEPLPRCTAPLPAWLTVCLHLGPLNRTAGRRTCRILS